MPSRPRKTAKSDAPADEKIAAKARETVGKVQQQRIDQTGLTNRVRGHVSARTKRVQAKRDAR